MNNKVSGQQEISLLELLLEKGDEASESPVIWEISEQKRCFLVLQEVGMSRTRPVHGMSKTKTVGYPFLYEGEVCLALAPNFKLPLYAAKAKDLIINGINIQKRYCELYRRTEFNTEISPLTPAICSSISENLRKKLEWSWIASRFLGTHTIEGIGYYFCGLQVLTNDGIRGTFQYTSYSKGSVYNYNDCYKVTPIIHLPANAKIVRKDGEKEWRVVIPKDGRITRKLFAQSEPITIISEDWRRFEDTCTAEEFSKIIQQVETSGKCSYEYFVKLFNEKDKFNRIAELEAVIQKAEEEIKKLKEELSDSRSEQE